MTTKIFGYDPDQAYDEIVNAPIVEKPKIIQPEVTNPNEWVILPGTNDYADTLVQLSRDLKGNQWEQTHRLLQQDEHCMLTIRQFADFLKLLKFGKVLLADGKTLLSQTSIDKVLDEILTVRYPYRAEWLDAKFEKQGKNMLIHYNHRIQNGILVSQNTEKLEDYLNQDKTPRIDLESWLNNTNKYGLPKPTTASGTLYYWKPINESVARFGAYSNRAILSCNGNPTFTNAGLGVRRAREK